jgi:hypothetical protein
MVFRRVRGKTVIAQRPYLRSSEGSAAQQAQREKFTLARAYAKGVLADPWQRQAYEKTAKRNNRRVDLLVVSDFLTPPVVEVLDVSGYQRQPGGIIRILAEDDIEVVSVEVILETISGESIERGFATSVHGVWCYRTTTSAPMDVPLVVTAIALDRPGHGDTATHVMPA